MGKSSDDDSAKIKLTRVEDEGGNALVTITLNDDNFFTLFGNNLRTEGLKFYASTAKNGASIQNIEIHPVPNGNPTQKRLKMIATAHHVDKQYRNIPLWLVGFVDLQNYDSLEVLEID